MAAVQVPDEQVPGSTNAAEHADGFSWAHLFPTYDAAEVAADWLIHIIGICVGAIGAIAVVLYAARYSYPLGIVATSLYAASLIAVFGFSTAYNHSPPSRRRDFIRRCDHASIYFLIASTHSAIAFSRIDIAASHWPAIFSWSVAIAGAFVKIA